MYVILQIFAIKICKKFEKSERIERLANALYCIAKVDIIYGNKIGILWLITVTK